MKILTKGKMAIAMAFVASVTFAANNEKLKNPVMTFGQAKMSAAASGMALATASNYMATVGMMTSDTKDAFVDFFEKTRLNGKQYFAPDFFKFNHLVMGGSDSGGFLMGLYNPFYDAIALFLIENGEPAHVTGFKMVSCSDVRNDKMQLEFPLASGLKPADEYLSALLMDVSATTAAFLDKFGRPDFRSRFVEVNSIAGDALRKLIEVHKFRIGQIIKMSEDKDVMKDVAVANAVLREVVTADNNVLQEDAATRKVAALLGGTLSSVRKDMQVIAYFPDGDDTNVVFMNERIRSMLVHARVRRGRIRLRLLDLNLVGNGSDVAAK